MSFNVIPLNIAELVLSGEPSVVSTILGSCVSVCLFSPEKKIGGIIHFALPSPEVRDGKTLEDPLRYGETAIPLLIKELTKFADVPASSLHSKILGGAATMDELQYSYNIGMLNVQIAERILRDAGIRIAGKDVGGTSGRKVLFYTDSGRVRVSKILKTNEESPKEVASQNISRTADSMSLRKKRVLIIDDSKTIRDILTKVLNEDPQLEVVGAAENPIKAEIMIKELLPDVLTLDIHMPEMDGITFLEKRLSSIRLPVVMITSISMEESNYVFRALELGAVDYIQKPNLKDLPFLAPLIRESVLTAANIKNIKAGLPKKKLTPAHTMLSNPMNQGTIVALGASTGGTEALKDVLIRLPKEIPPIVVVQHIPPVFSAAFAKRLNELCPFEVKEAQNGDLLEKEKVLIAPGGKQMAIEPCPAGYRVKITDDPPMTRHKPSVDYLFLSVAAHVRDRSIGVILTGMGSDGAIGLLEMRKNGAFTMAQDEETSVVYGMPKVAYERGAVKEVHSLEKIPEVIIKKLSKKIAFKDK